MLHTDVLVVGAGPAGCTAATVLARAGLDVTLVDKSRFPRDKCCGDGLTAAALRELETLGLDPGAVPSWTTVEAAWVRSPSGRTVHFPLPPTARGQFAAIAPRLELDAALVDLAKASGAKVHDGHGLRGVHEGDGEAIVVDVEGLGDVRARFAVGADGMWSPFRKALHLDTPGYLGEWHAFRQYFQGVTGPAADQLWIWFDADLLPGYAWSFPLGGGRANVGVGVQRLPDRRIQDMKRLWPSVLSRPHVQAVLGPGASPASPHKAWPIPARIDKAALAGRRVLFVGDAAGACDLMTGEGIAQALLTGRLAAGALLSVGLAAQDEVGDAYRDAVQRELVPDHRMATALSHVLRHERGARGAVRGAGLTALTRRGFARWLFEDEPRAVVVTPRRWHRRFLDRPGAFRP